MKKINWEKKRKSFAIAALRRASLRWPARNEAKKLARTSRGKYQCASCKDQFGPTQIHLDHIKPVVNLKGFISWDEYINGLFCDVNNYAVLCVPCHETKTILEGEMRDYYKKSNENKKNKVDKPRKK